MNIAVATTVSAGPINRPVTLDEAKAHLRVDSNDEDAVISGMIDAATAYVESRAGVSLGTRTIVDYFEAATDFCLSTYPVSSVTKLEYRNESGNYTELNTSYYEYELVTIPATVRYKKTVTPPTVGDYPNAVRITYTTGALDANKLAIAKMAILLSLADMYQNREDGEVNERNNPRYRASNLLIGTLREIMV